MALALRNQAPSSPGTVHKNTRNGRPSPPPTSSVESTFSNQQIPPAVSQPGEIRGPAARPNGIADIYSGGSSSSDNDGVNNSTSSSATALRRLYFKTGRNTKTKTNAKSSMSMTKLAKTPVCNTAILYNASVEGAPHSGGKNAANSKSVPKVVVMGSSTASTTDAIINTSTDSASTMVTNVTHTDTSETCDSLDLGDNSGQSEPIFSSLEEPLLTAIQVDSEQEVTEFELTSCSSYSRPDVNLQDSTEESQESCLSILTNEPTSTTPLLSSCRKYAASSSSAANTDKERLPSTAPAPSSGGKHFTFDQPQSPKSARCSDKSRTCFIFKEEGGASILSSQQQQRKFSQRHGKHEGDKRQATAAAAASICADDPNGKCEQQHTGETQKYAGHFHGERSNFSDMRKTRNEGNAKERNRYSMGATIGTQRTSPKREHRRSPSMATSKVNSAPPTIKDSNFFDNAYISTRHTNKQLSPTSGQRKYSSSSSSGGSERYKEGILFPFDREALDYERIQRECFAVNENSSSSTTTSDTDEAENCSVYERPKCDASNPTDFYQQYTLLSQTEQQQQKQHSRKNSKRLRSDSLVQKYVPKSDAFCPKSISSSPTTTHYSPNSHVELRKFEDIASKFEQMAPNHGSIVNLAIKPPSPNATTASSNHSLNSSILKNSHYSSNNNINNNNNTHESISPVTSSSPCNSRSTTPPLPNVRVDFFMEKLSTMHSRKKSFKNKSNVAIPAIEEIESAAGIAGAHDYLDDCQYGGAALINAAAISGGGPINVTPNPMEVTAVCSQPPPPPRATIVVQQPSLSLDSTIETLLIKSENDFISVEQDKDPQTSSLSVRKRNSQQLNQAPTITQLYQQKRDDNIRQLLDVTNTLTFEELRDFEMRYGSPHHSRSQSVKTPGSRASGRPNQLCLPQQRSRVASMPNTGVEEEYYRLRHFSITGKGVINRGDSLKSRRSKSNNSVASSNSSNEHLTAPQAPQATRSSANHSLASSRESSTSNPGNGPYRVLMMGAPAVGKSSLVSQFMTSEYLHAYDTSIDDDSGEKSVSVLLSGEESELIFIDHPYAEMTPDDCLTCYDPHGYCVIYSASDRESFSVAEHILQVLWTNQNIAQKAVILVANKADLARSRSISADEGKAMATAYDCKFIETSVGINHNVDELLVGLLSQIRLKLENPEKSRDMFRKRSIRKSKRRACSPLSGACLTGNVNANTPLGPMANIISEANTPPGSAHSSPRKYRGSRTSTSLKVKGLLGRVWARDSKSKSCENLHVL
ncbi:dual specificity protein kinase splA isoform X2 [Stomoxys calcitrans]|uniref:dual specificity protein kinase splA isoform X2 n=1 Tax=Stomoxys calcitrans TaxID=35570 RepID=UPI0027E37EEB|nr:dual specificity protein kinase splA isoform X2 [Stomoxys calcitrans]